LIDQQLKTPTNKEKNEKITTESTSSNIIEIFNNPNSTEKINIILDSNKPALRDFISPEIYSDRTFNLKNARNQEMEV
jgi:uncharacterized Zn-finger protein